MVSSPFTPLVQAWFKARYGQPTPVQRNAWPVVASGDNALISAPTGGGKSLAAWLPLIDRLYRSDPKPGTRLLYISPLRALSSDMAAGLLECLEGLTTMDNKGGGAMPRVGVRSGDTSQSERARHRRRPPEILLTTPESLFVMLGSRGGRNMLCGVESVIIDEVHALIENKRGAHLSLSLERLQALTGENLQRVGLSATVRPLRLVAGFVAGNGRECKVVTPDKAPPPQVRVELPDAPLGALATGAHWQWIGQRLNALAHQRGAMLVFCNTRALVERVASRMGESMEADQVAAHHGSLGRKHRQSVEAGLKAGRIKVVVSSSSLELGIDIGDLDRVCQIGSASGINAFRQRAGRARHRPGQRPRIHAFPLTLSDLLQTRAVIDALEMGKIDRSCMLGTADDVLVQHLIAMVAAGMTDRGQLQALIRRAVTWRHLNEKDLGRLIDMVHDGFVPGRETSHSLVYRRGPVRLGVADEAEKLSLMNAGTIPEWFDYEVLDLSTRQVIGRLDEEFAFESTPGQVIQLGGSTWKILAIATGRVEVEPADNLAPNLPFWFGDGAGRSSDLSLQVMQLCRWVEQGQAVGCSSLQDYLSTSLAVLGRLPGPDCIVLERFFDPGGDQHLVIHTLAGARTNRAWGLALRKRFCRQFNFELQAAATDDGLLISLGAVHSFDLPEVMGYLRSSNARDVLVQALLDTPIFQTRFRWCANIALAIKRRELRGPVPPQIQRSQTENLIARIFPDQLACLENLSGTRRIPDHPLVAQALADCLNDYMDVNQLERMLTGIESGRIGVHAIDTDKPSPLAEALIHAPRHSFLDPAAAEERRTRSFEQPASPTIATPPYRPQGRDEFERSLLTAGYLTASEGEVGGNATRLMTLVHGQLAVSLSGAAPVRVWAHVERLAELLAIWPDARIKPFLPSGLIPAPQADGDEALRRLMLGRIRYCRTVTVNRLAGETGLSDSRIELTLAQLKAEGLITVMTAGDGNLVWRERLPEPVALAGTDHHAS